MKGLTQLSLPCPRNLWAGGKQLRSLREALAADWSSSRRRWKQSFIRSLLINFFACVFLFTMWIALPF
jgi:hypothetical protein